MFLSQLLLDNSSNVIAGGITLNNMTDYDFYVVKYDAFGSSLLSRTFNSASDHLIKLLTDNSRSIFIISKLSGPFNPKTIMNYELKVPPFVSIKVFDILGNEVRNMVNKKLTAGSYGVEFDGGDLSSGI